jgi:hypothetical protein
VNKIKRRVNIGVITPQRVPSANSAPPGLYESGAVAPALHDLSAHPPRALNAKRRGARNASSALAWTQAFSPELKNLVSHLVITIGLELAGRIG